MESGLEFDSRRLNNFEQYFTGGYRALQNKEPYLKNSQVHSGGEGGIRTHGRFDPTPDFESGTFDHSATSPNLETIIASMKQTPYCQRWFTGYLEITDGLD